eukprot:3931160-Prymnesium_polylepis.3
MLHCPNAPLPQRSTAPKAGQRGGVRSALRAALRGLACLCTCRAPGQAVRCEHVGALQQRRRHVAAR